MRAAGLEIKIDRTAYRGFLTLVLIPFFVIGGYAVIFRRPELQLSTFVSVLLVSLCVAIYHVVAQFVHQLGHALAARLTGYPMTGTRYEWGFSYSEYPSDEPLLPDSIHIRRSLGGVVGVTLMLVLVVVLWLQVDTTASWLTRWLLNFLLFDSLLLFVASAVISDGLLFIRQRGWDMPQPDA